MPRLRSAGKMDLAMSNRLLLLPLLLVAVALLFWITRPVADEASPRSGAGQPGQDGSGPSRLHVDGDRAWAGSAAGPELEVRGEAMPGRGAGSKALALAALIHKLSSDDAEARRGAAKEIVRSYWLELVARQTAALDTASWQTFAEAVFKRKPGLAPACCLVAAAHGAPAAHRRRLIDLARRLNPEAGRTPTPQEIEALLHHELVENRGRTDHRSFIGQSVAIYGRAGVPATLKHLRESNPDVVDMDRAHIILSSIAQPEDIPALRKLLLAGRSSVAFALGRLAALGFAKASDALTEAVLSGQFDAPIARALCRTWSRSKTAQALRALILDRGPGLTDAERSLIASVFAALESRRDVPTLAAWASRSRNAATLVALGRALTQLGSVKGIDLLVRIVGEKEVDPVRRQRPEDSGRLTAGGFERWRRGYALRMLNAVAVQLVDWEDSDWLDEEGPWKKLSYGDVDQAVPDVRAWWEASRDKIRFDETAGEWRLESD